MARPRWVSGPACAMRRSGRGQECWGAGQRILALGRRAAAIGLRLRETRRDAERCESPLCIGHSRSSAQQAMRASGVGAHPAQIAAFPATTQDVRARAARRWTSLTTLPGCSTVEAPSNEGLSDASSDVRCVSAERRYRSSRSLRLRVCRAAQSSTRHLWPRVTPTIVRMISGPVGSAAGDIRRSTSRSRTLDACTATSFSPARLHCSRAFATVQRWLNRTRLRRRVRPGSGCRTSSGRWRFARAPPSPTSATAERLSHDSPRQGCRAHRACICGGRGAICPAEAQGAGVEVQPGECGGNRRYRH